MKLTKAQEDFLNICWKMKVVNIVPQAGKLGIPEASVREYLATKGLAIDGAGFVFQGRRDGMRIYSDRDFRTAMTAAYMAFVTAIDQAKAAQKRRERRQLAAQPCSRAGAMDTARIQKAQGDIVDLLGFLLGSSLPIEERKRMVEMCDQAIARAQIKSDEPRPDSKGRKKQIGSPVAFYGKNPPKRRW